jgi:excisionase family DNA binding protein
VTTESESQVSEQGPLGYTNRAAPKGREGRWLVHSLPLASSFCCWWGDGANGDGVRETKGPAREVMSPEDLAEYLGLGRTYTYKLLMTGAISSFKIGRLRRIRRADVDAYLEEQLRSQVHAK